MEESHAMLISTQNSDSPGAVVLSVALIDPDNSIDAKWRVRWLDFRVHPFVNIPPFRPIWMNCRKCWSSVTTR